LIRIDDRGIIYCSGIGGIDPIVLVGQIVHINTNKGTIHGVVTCKEIWAGKDMKKPPNIEEILIDTGLSKEELLKVGVTLGSYMTLEEKPYNLGSDNIICGKALDDRIGCFILVELAKKLRNIKNEVYYVFTVQEEFGLYGARTSAFKIEPDWGIAVDITHANDVFDEPTRIIGNGPIITIKDGELIANRMLNEKLINVAKRKKIPYQLAVIEIGTTDATTISVSKGGVPTTVFGVPIRNIHTTISIAHKSDIENAIKILEEFLKSA
jgi:endoglucanase